MFWLVLGRLPCSIVTCALTMKYYVEENVSQRSCTTIRHVVKMLGTISETLIFFFLGVVTITTEHEWNWGYILFTLLFAFVWRGLGTIGGEGSSVWARCGLNGSGTSR